MTPKRDCYSVGAVTNFFSRISLVFRGVEQSPCGGFLKVGVPVKEIQGHCRAM